MNAVSFSKQTLVVSFVGAAMALSASALWAADIDTVKVIYDQDVAARTNMGQRDTAPSTLKVGRDSDYLTRTNLPKPEGDGGAVGVARDADYMSRTNMGGTAMKVETPQTTVSQH